MVWENTYILLADSMKANGIMMRNMVKEYSNTEMGKFMKVIGSKAKELVMDYINLQMETGSKGNFLIIKEMAMEYFYAKIMTDMKGSGLMVKEAEKGSRSTPMEIFMLVNGKKIKDKAVETIDGHQVRLTRDIGKMIL